MGLIDMIKNALQLAIQKASNYSNRDKPEQASKSIASESESTKAKDLLAFRTIITMLSQIQSECPNSRFATTAPIGTAKDDRKTLRVLDALSTVLIREHEITAVVAHPYDGVKLQVFASVIYPSKTEPSLLQPAAETGGQSIWDRFTVAVNPRVTKINNNDDSLVNSTSLPILDDHQDKVPGELVNAAKGNVSVLDIYLKTHWRVFQ